MHRAAPRPDRAASRLFATATLLAAGLAACGDRADPVRPSAGPDLARASFVMSVDVERGTATVAPQHGVATRRAGSRAGGDRPSFSLVGGEVISLGATVLPATPLPNGKVRVPIDVTIRNDMLLADLVTPTFPAPPAGLTGILLVPYALGVGSDRLDAGLRASPDWDGDGSPGSGAPHNFFNDFAGCGRGTNPDCVRWEAFAAPLRPGQTSETRRVGFDVPANTPKFQVALILAADEVEHQFGAVAGRVATPSGVPLPGATVRIAGSTVMTTTAQDGTYRLTYVPAGPTTLSVQGFPAGCQVIAPVTVDVGVLATAAGDVAVPCFAPVTGSVRTATGDVLPGRVVSQGVAYDANGPGGSYRIPSVPVGPTTLSFIYSASHLSCSSQSYTVTVPFGGLAYDGVVPCRVAVRMTVRELRSNPLAPSVVPGATVSVDNGSPATANSQGSADLGLVLIGDRLVTISAAGCDPQTVTRTVSLGTTSLVADLPCFGHALGVAYDNHGNKLAGATISLGGASDVTTFSGSFDLGRVPTGSYPLQITNLPPNCVLPATTVTITRLGTVTLAPVVNCP